MLLFRTSCWQNSLVVGDLRHNNAHATPLWWVAVKKGGPGFSQNPPDWVAPTSWLSLYWNSKTGILSFYSSSYIPIQDQVPVSSIFWHWSPKLLIAKKLSRKRVSLSTVSMVTVESQELSGTWISAGRGPYNVHVCSDEQYRARSIDSDTFRCILFHENLCILIQNFI